MNEYLNCWSKYAMFSGRSRRREYWLFVLINFMVCISARGVGDMIGAGVEISLVYSLSAVIPSLAVAIRRLHDTGRSGWWWLINLIPLFGGILLLLWLCEDSQPGENEYGANPKE